VDGYRGYTASISTACSWPQWEPSFWKFTTRSLADEPANKAKNETDPPPNRRWRAFRELVNDDTMMVVMIRLAHPRSVVDAGREVADGGGRLIARGGEAQYAKGERSGPTHPAGDVGGLRALRS
jgi:hypothetical protein